MHSTILSKENCSEGRITNIGPYRGGLDPVPDCEPESVIGDHQHQRKEKGFSYHIVHLELFHRLLLLLSWG